MIKFEWDSLKDASKVAKHGISFTEATAVFGDHLAKIFPDPDPSIGEQRELIVGHNHGDKLLYVSVA